MSPLKIIFMGSAAFAAPSLRLIHKSEHEITVVIAQPDKPAGRGMVLTPPPVAKEAASMGLPVYQPKSVKAAKVIEKIRSSCPDLITVVAYGKILPAELLKIPRLGCINLHPSLLPKYRGAAPINWAIINGEKVSGVTTMFINEELDAGNTLLKKSVDIMDDDTAITLHDRLALIGAELLLETIDKLRNNSIAPQPQDNSKASFAPMLKKEDGHINWKENATSIRNLIRGMQPWPSAYTHLNGKTLRIFDATAQDATSNERPGTVVRAKDSIIVATGGGVLHINELQLEGKRRMTSRDFLNGHKIKDKTILE